MDTCNYLGKDYVFEVPFHVRTLHRPLTTPSTESLDTPKEKDSVSEVDYNSLFKHVCTVRSLPEFSYVLHHLPTTELEPITEISIFSENSMPTWEHPTNKDGAQWSLKVKRELADRLFMKLALKFVCVGFKAIRCNGLVLSIRKYHAFITLWSEDYDSSFYTAVNSEINSLLKVPFKISMYAKRNCQSMEDKSTFSRRKRPVHDDDGNNLPVN